MRPVLPHHRAAEAPVTTTAARVEGWVPPPSVPVSTPPPPPRARRATLWRALEHTLLGLLATAAAAAIGASWLQARLATTPPFVPLRSVYDAYVDSTPVTASISVPGRQLPWPTTASAVLGDATLWRMMHLADWNRLPTSLREAGLDAMLERYHAILVSPPAWDRMRPDDWDRIPQPIRTVAFRHMVAYWAGYYDLGTAQGLPPALVADTLAAIVMSESWFEHRTVAVNRDGTRDLGLAGASEFARGRLRELHARGLVDFGPEDAAYFDPWVSTRFAAVWFGLLLDEADGDLDRAIGAYNRGIAGASDAIGVQYRAMVGRRQATFIRNTNAPVAWDYIWRRARAIERQAWPWMGATHE